jgi:UDP-glucose 4-epimerase
MINNILITHGASYVRSHLAIKLLELDHNATLVDNFSNSNKLILNKIKEITNKKILFFNKKCF